MRVEKDFKEFIVLLNLNKVKYLVVGGFAFALYAKPRFTKDIDVFVEASEANSKRIIKTLNEFGFGGIGLKEKDFQEHGQIIQLGHPPMRIDIITSASGITFEEAWDNRNEGKYGDTACLFISIDDLIKNKKASARAQDIADVSALNTIYDTYISGVLGHDFLKKGKISVNIKKKEFHMKFY